MKKYNLIIGLSTAVLSQQIFAAKTTGEIYPDPTPKPFGGKIEPRMIDSIPSWPRPATPPQGAPNVVLIILDDVGFGAASTFGGPIPTPNFDRLAERGLKYTQFHTTALSAPTRAALITGRNHHSVHTGSLMETALGYPGYDTLMGKDTVTVAEVLKENGYSTAWFGKNHNVPDWQNSSRVGPFDLWPNNLGFEYFYGFIGADINQWRPGLYENFNPIEPYLNKPNYILNTDLADKAIEYMQQQKSLAPNKPFFIYYAPGATHAPHQVPKEWIVKFKGKFDYGWDKQRELTFARQKQLGIIPQDAKLTPRPTAIPAWDSFDKDHKVLFARMMEVYAAFLAQTDYEVGRVLDEIDSSGQRDNTLVILIIGDNGASAEGSINGSANEYSFVNGVQEDIKPLLKHIDDLGSAWGYNHYPVGWAFAMNTPFQWCKQIASHFGGTRNGLVISWPRRITQVNQMRTQWHHVVDITPTILEATGLNMPKEVNGVTQKPIEGVSMVYTWDNAQAKSHHNTQYFEMGGNRAIYHDGWVAATTPVYLPWIIDSPKVDVIDGYNWELYDVERDFSEADDLAKKMPKKLKEMQGLFYQEATKYNVLPLNNDRLSSLDPSVRPSLSKGRTSFTYYDGMTRIPESIAADTKNKSFSIVAKVKLLNKSTSGMIVTQGGRYNGWGLYMRNGKIIYFYNLVNLYHKEIISDNAIGTGEHVITFNFTYDGGGVGKGGNGELMIDGKKAATGRIDRTIPSKVTGVSASDAFDIGEDLGTPLNESYDAPFRFEGVIHNVTIKLLSKKETQSKFLSN